MFWRVIGFASEIGHETSDSESSWLLALDSIEDKFGATPTITFDEIWTPDELELGSEIMFEVAQRIFERRIGIHTASNWQTSTIWAAHDLARLLDREWRTHRAQEDTP